MRPYFVVYLYEILKNKGKQKKSHCIEITVLSVRAGLFCDSGKNLSPHSTLSWGNYGVGGTVVCM